MLRVRAIRKFHDAKGILLGYTIKDEATGQEMNIHKDQLKNAVINKQCEVVNMTLTSDGRLIGKAAPKAKSKATKNKMGINLLEVYTNGRNIVAGLVDSLEFHKLEGVTPEEFKGVQLGCSFEAWSDISSMIKSNSYDNVKIVDGKPDMSNVKRKSFKSIKPRLLKLLDAHGIDIKLSVEKGNAKNEYNIIIDNYDSIDAATAVQIIMCLIEDAMITHKLTNVIITDENVVSVQCYTGINDVRKAIKSVNK